MLTRRSVARPKTVAGAQRLPASSEYSHWGGPCVVINVVVLNASRHHRNTHFAWDTKNADNVTCSTPFGIIGRLTSGRPYQQTPYSSALNAFRHHRKTPTCRTRIWRL